MGTLDESPAILPDADSLDLHLSHPTAAECQAIWKLSSHAWKDALSLPQYLEESAYMTTVPLAKDGGMTNWILTDKNLPPDLRPILCSCETFRKRAFVSDRDGNLSEKIVHGVASVFCDPGYRQRGYGSRLMRELSETLRNFQTTGESDAAVGSVLYSDIGQKFYAGFGWHPFPIINTHIELDACVYSEGGPKATHLFSEDIQRLCEKDEAMIRKELTSTLPNGKIRLILVPDLNHMLWHHSKEDFVCQKLFGKQPQIKGAVVGQPGNRIWAIWTHRFYGDLKSASSENTLYILRLVIENPAAPTTLDADQQEIMEVEYMRQILQAAQDEAFQWNMHRVVMWGPAALVLRLVNGGGIQYRKVSRDHEGIASLLWYGEGSGKEDSLEWLGNEKYGWC